MKLKLKALNFLGLTLAGVINAIGVCLFLTPLYIYDGGFSGTSVLLNRYIAFLPQAVRDTMPTAKTRVNNKEIILFIILLLNLLHIGTVNPVTVL